MLWTFFLAICSCGASCEALNAADLAGTWISKSKSVVTGPDFFNPFNETLIEPERTGISYSFTEDFFFEEALYRVTANPTNPSCPTGVLQFQHGKYQILENGSLYLVPFERDGRQLLSDPCNYRYSQYIRYNQTELFDRFEVKIDQYRKEYSLQLYAFDGAPVQPMYLAYKPPKMLPTEPFENTKAKRKRSWATYSSTKFIKYKVTKSFSEYNYLILGLLLTAMGAIGLLLNNGIFPRDRKEIQKTSARMPY